MGLLRTMLLTCCILFYFLAFAQDERDAKIDSVSIKMIQYFQEDDIGMIECHLVKREDLEHVLSLFEEKMSVEEIERSRAEMDSLPEKEKEDWIKKSKTVREKGENMQIDWNRIQYLRSEIEYEKGEMVDLEVAHVIAIFEQGDRTYALKYDCLEMPRGMVLGGGLEIVEQEESDE